MRLLSQAALVALLSSRVLGHPHANPVASIRGRSVDLSAFRLKSISEYSDVATTADANIVLPVGFDTPTYTQTAIWLVQEVFPEADFRLVTEHYVGNDGIGHVTFKQTAHGLDIDNADFNVNVSLNPQTGLYPRLTNIGCQRWFRIFLR